MTNSLVPAGPVPVIPMFAELPPVSGELSWMLGQIDNPHPDVGEPRAFPAHVKAEAKAAFEALSTIAAPVSAVLFHAWLRPAMRMAPPPLSPAEISELVGILWDAFSNYPTGAFTLAARRELVRSCVFRPAGPDIERVIADDARAIRSRVAGLRAILSGKTEFPPSLPRGHDAGRRVAQPTASHSGVLEPAEPHEPVRTVEEQLAALGFDPAGKPLEE